MSIPIVALASTLFLFFAIAETVAGTVDHLAKCREKHVAPLRSALAVFRYHENRNTLYHSPEPWQVMNSRGRGVIWCNAESFLQLDSVQFGEKFGVSKIQFTPAGLLIQKYWHREPAMPTKSMIADQAVETARYSPAMLISYFLEHHPGPDKSSTAEHAVYTLDINKTIVQLHIRTSDFLLEKVVLMQNHDILGDLTTTLTYGNFTQHGDLHYAQNVRIEKVKNITDEVTLEMVELTETAPTLVEKPVGYAVKDDDTAVPEVTVEKMSDNMYAINLLHAETKVGLVEFRDFLVVFDVPLNSANGELVLKEAQKLAPGKPVKYYAFGHHHPWYIGGVRPFIRNGTTVLCRKENIDYVKFVADAPHTLKPDSLHMQPRPLKTQLLDSITTITDGSFEMKICHIGKQSEHTSDYLLFYFPSEKIVWQGDLAWMPQKGAPMKASKQQAGLYNAITNLGLDVETIVQTWPIGEKYGSKPVFSFDELEESVKVE